MTQITEHQHCRRLAKAMNRAYDVPEWKCITNLQAYRSRRDRKAVDWEGEMAQFQRIIRSAIKYRHFRATKDMVEYTG